ncbi:MAG: hypothetical protein P8P48_03455 [Saprospiraceae bacterium]|nr:hypothetical protein [Saprospiraceae bacterium]
MRVKLLVAISLAILPTLLFAQESPVFKFKATAMATLSAETGNEWGEWVDVNEFVIMNSKTGRVVITGTKDLYFDVISTESVSNPSEDIIVETDFECFDSFGNSCGITVQMFKNDTSHLYINYSDYRYVFHLEYLN